MVWPFNKSQQEDTKHMETKKETKYLLEDTEPRFENESQSKKPDVQQAFQSIKADDFAFNNLKNIPCFRDAMLAGFTSMAVLGSVMFVVHKNPSRAANWSVGGFMLGSIIGWEQCRSRRRRSFEIAELAKRTVAAKEKPMMHQHEKIDAVKQEWEGHTSSFQGKPWYKFW